MQRLINFKKMSSMDFKEIQGCLMIPFFEFRNISLISLPFFDFPRCQAVDYCPFRSQKSKDSFIFAAAFCFSLTLFVLFGIFPDNKFISRHSWISMISGSCGNTGFPEVHRNNSLGTKSV